MKFFVALGVTIFVVGFTGGLPLTKPASPLDVQSVLDLAKELPDALKPMLDDSVHKHAEARDRLADLHRKLQADKDKLKTDKSALSPLEDLSDVLNAWMKKVDDVMDRTDPNLVDGNVLDFLRSLLQDKSRAVAKDMYRLKEKITETTLDVANKLKIEKIYQQALDFAAERIKSLVKSLKETLKKRKSKTKMYKGELVVLKKIRAKMTAALAEAEDLIQKQFQKTDSKATKRMEYALDLKTNVQTILQSVEKKIAVLKKKIGAMRRSRFKSLGHAKSADVAKEVSDLSGFAHTQSSVETVMQLDLPAEIRDVYFHLVRTLRDLLAAQPLQTAIFELQQEIRATDRKISKYDRLRIEHRIDELLDGVSYKLSLMIKAADKKDRLVFQSLKPHLDSKMSFVKEDIEKLKKELSIEDGTEFPKLLKGAGVVVF